MRFLRLALATCIVALGVTAAFGQSGGISVIVVDDQGEALPGATVTISNETGFIKTTAELTGKSGVVDFPVLRPGGGYAIQVAFPGFSTQRFPDLRVRINQTETLTVQMIEELQEKVTVRADREVIDLDKTEQSTRFTDNFIQDLPVPGRFYQNVLTMAPGVQDADGDGNPNVHGSRSRDFQAVVSGVSNVDPLTGQWMSRINPNSIEEMEVITAGAGVEFGRAQGGFARIIQKQGSNTHEGVFEFYWQTSKLDGTGADNNSALPDPKFDTIQPLFQFSGPLVKDKLWYRASYERREFENPVNIIGGVAVQTQDTETQDAQITWQASPRNKLAFQYRSDPLEADNLGISNLRAPSAAILQDREVDTYQLTWTAPYSPKVLVESTVAWQDVQTFQGPTTQGTLNNCLDSSDGFLNEAQCRDLDSNQVSGSYFRADLDNRQRFTVKGDATVFGGRFWGMSHQFKLGISVENERYFRDLTRAPSVGFFVVDVPADDPDDPDATPEAFGIALTRLAVPESDEVRATGTNWALYAEDQFKPAQNLTITVGARLDREEINSEGVSQFDPLAELAGYSAAVAANGGTDDGSIWPNSFTAYEDIDSFESQLQQVLCGNVAPDQVGNCLIDVSESILAQNQRALTQKRRQQSIDLSNTNVSPRVALSWSPWSNGKTAFKFAAGRNYNNIPLLVPLQELEPAFTDLVYRVDLASGQTLLEGGISPTINVTTVDRDLDTPFQDEFTFSIDRELWAETSMTFTYINRKFKDQIQDFNINLDTGDFGRCVLQNQPNQHPVVPSPGEGDVLLNPYTGQEYIDTDPGPGDGLLDDCIGENAVIDLDPTQNNEDDPFGSDILRVQRPDGVTDLYLQNPFWGDIFRVGNFNEIDYQAYVIELVRRQYRSWEMNASYTWSEAEGDGEDFFQELGDDPSLRDNVKGYQSYDQRHVVKLNATTITPWGVRLGTSVSWQSGLPYSLLIEEPSRDTLPPASSVFGGEGNRRRQTYTTGERNDQRNDSYWNVDLKATKELKLGKGLNLQLSAEIFNLLDDNTYIVYNPFLERGVQVNGFNEAQRRFGRQWQVGMKLAF